VDLGELDCLYASNTAELNDCLIKKLNTVAFRHCKRSKPKFKKNSKNNKGWWNKDIDLARKQRRDMNRKRRATKKFDKGEISEGVFHQSWEAYREAKKVTSDLIKQARSTQEKKLLEKVKEQGNGETTDWYRFLRDDKYENVTQGCIKVGDRLLEDKWEITEELEKYRGAIVGPPKGRRVYTFNGDTTEQKKEMIMNLERPSRNEIRLALKKLKDIKGVGFDGIPYEFLKKEDHGWYKLSTNYMGKSGSKNRYQQSGMRAR